MGGEDLLDLRLLIVAQNGAREAAAAIALAIGERRVASEHLAHTPPLAEALARRLDRLEHCRGVIGGIRATIGFGVRAKAAVARDMAENRRHLRRVQPAIERRGAELPRVEAEGEGIGGRRIEQPAFHE